MEWIWKGLAKMASKRLSAYEVKRHGATIINRLDCLAGQNAIDHEDIKILVRSTIDEEISNYWRSNGPILVQQLAAGVDPKLSDQAVVLKEIGEKTAARHSTMLAGLAGRMMVSLNNAKDTAEQNYNSLLQGQEEIARQAAIYDQHGSDRFLTILNKLDLQQGMVLSLFRRIEKTIQDGLWNVTQQIQNPPAEAKQRYSPAPSLQWLMDNADTVIDIGTAFGALRDNSGPDDLARPRAIKAIRSLGLFTMQNVSDEVKRITDLWNNDQQLQAA